MENEKWNWKQRTKTQSETWKNKTTHCKPQTPKIKQRNENESRDLNRTKIDSCTVNTKFLQFRETSDGNRNWWDSIPCENDWSAKLMLGFSCSKNKNRKKRTVDKELLEIDQISDRIGNWRDSIVWMQVSSLVKSKKRETVKKKGFQIDGFRDWRWNRSQFASWNCNVTNGISIAKTDWVMCKSIENWTWKVK